MGAFNFYYYFFFSFTRLSPQCDPILLKFAQIVCIVVKRYSNENEENMPNIMALLFFNYFSFLRD